MRRTRPDERGFSPWRKPIIIAGNETGQEHTRVTGRRPAQHGAESHPEVGECALRAR